MHGEEVVGRGKYAEGGSFPFLVLAETGVRTSLPVIWRAITCYLLPSHTYHTPSVETTMHDAGNSVTSPDGMEAEAFFCEHPLQKWLNRGADEGFR